MIELKRHTPAKRNMVPWNASISVKNGKYFITINDENHINERQNDAPKSLTFSGIISEMTTNGKVQMPHAATNSTNEKLTIGIQLYASTS